jgi:hypothetical protein
MNEINYDGWAEILDTKKGSEFGATVVQPERTAYQRVRRTVRRWRARLHRDGHLAREIRRVRARRLARARTRRPIGQLGR